MPDSSTFAPQSFFFTDPAAISQSENQAFGPINENEFRLTAKFSLGANAPAYAVCPGIVLIQPQAASGSRVNLVIRPFKQPIQGLNIQYFVYRGLNIADFFNNDNVIPAAGSTSDFINSVNAAFTAYYTHISPGEALPEFKAKYLGYDPANQSDTTLISDLFFKQSVTAETPEATEQMAFELPLVPAGASLGNFGLGECGLDIVLSYGDYRLPEPNDEFRFDLAYARKPEATINLSAETNDFKKKRIREQIFQFLDAAAYYGFHSIDSGEVDINIAGSKAIKKGLEIYDLMVSRFFTRNRLYLYIQSDRTRSYNFYGNYKINNDNENSIKLGITETSLSELEYSTFGWPLIINESIRTHDDPPGAIYLQLVTNGNVNTMLYGQVAQLSNAPNRNLIGIDELLVINEDGTTSNLTKVLLIINPGVNVDNYYKHIANFNFLIYQGSGYNYSDTEDLDAPQTNNIVTPSRSYLYNDVFDLINAETIIRQPDIENYISIVSQKIKLINHYYDGISFGISAAQTLIIYDKINQNEDTFLDRVTYCTESVQVLNDSSSANGAISADARSLLAFGHIANGKTFRLKPPFFLQVATFTDNANTVTSLKLATTDGSYPSKILIGITSEENQALQSIIEQSDFNNPRIVIINKNTDDSSLKSSEGITYTRYSIGISGETDDGILRYALIDQDIIIYSLDDKCFFSEKYSRYMLLDVNTSNDLLLDVRL